MARSNMTEVLKNLSTTDMQVDAEGRVVITNEELAAQLKEAGNLSPSPDALKDTNIICCGNEKCGGELSSLLDNVVRRGGGR